MNARALCLTLALAHLASGEEPPRATPVAPAPAQPSAPVPVPPPGSPPAASDNRSLSRSGQFHISGGDPGIRSTLAIVAENAKEELLRMLGEEDKWKIPVVITLHGTQNDPPKARPIAFDLIYNENGFTLLINLHLGHGIEQSRFEKAVTMALLYERCLRDKPPRALDTPMVAPPWLVEGLRESISWRAKRSDRKLYESVFKHGGFYDLETLFGVKDTEYDGMDAATSSAFRVSAGALVMALLEQPQGMEGFRAFLKEAPEFAGDMPILLHKHFPELNLSERSLAKWWALQMANMAAAPLTDVLTVQETETMLANALTLHFRNAEGVATAKPLSSDWQQLAALDPAARAAAVRPAQEELVRLSYRCFPSARPLLLEYQQVLANLANNRTTTCARQIQFLDETRTIMTQRIKRASDYLDWFEITRARETSGAFNDYLRLKERLAAPRTQRDDPVSRYLDRMQEAFGR